MSLKDDKEFQEFLGKSYQPSPFWDYYGEDREKGLKSTRGVGTLMRWEEIAKVLPKDRSFRILDIGCNLGYFGFLGALAGHKVDGFDTDEAYIYWANKIREDKDVPNVTFEVEPDDLLGVLGGIDDDSYDLVFYLSVHHHMCSSMGIEQADQIFREISRIAPRMIFDMGQSNEVDNGWLTWLNHVPVFADHRVEAVKWILGASDFNYGSVIGHTHAHEIERWLFYLVRNEPEDVNYAREIISIPLKDSNAHYGLTVEKYLWKTRRGSVGYGRFNESTTGFPVMDLLSDMAMRYYVALDMGGRKFFIKEFMQNWLSPWENEIIAKGEYDRGRVLAEDENLAPKIISPSAWNKNFVVFPYCEWENYSTFSHTKWMDFAVAEDMIQTAVQIYAKIGVFDLHTNNILYNGREFKFIDFSPVTVDATPEWWRNRLNLFVTNLSTFCGTKIKVNLIENEDEDPSS